MLVQIDGSHHHWLENRAESISLLATTDDATGKIVVALFRPQEDTEGYLRLTEQMIRQEGIPMSIPSDRHMIFRAPNDKQTLKQELEGEPVPLSQFGQALNELSAPLKRPTGSCWSSSKPTLTGLPSNPVIPKVPSFPWKRDSRWISFSASETSGSSDPVRRLLT